jgi:hypothetical protein
VNFDAETAHQALREEEYRKIYDFGVSWSETFQSSLFHDHDGISRIETLLKEFGERLSINLVIGNAAYGLKPSFSSLERMARRLSRSGMKLGVESRMYGRKAIDLASEIGASAYILHTGAMEELLRYSTSKGVSSSVYTLCRISGSGSSAVSEIVSIKGDGYFKRRGVAFEDISAKLGNLAIYGTRRSVVEQISSIFDLGARKVVLYPVFAGTNDLLNQMRELGEIIEQ